MGFPGGGGRVWPKSRVLWANGDILHSALTHRTLQVAEIKLNWDFVNPQNWVRIVADGGVQSGFTGRSGLDVRAGILISERAATHPRRSVLARLSLSTANPVGTGISEVPISSWRVVPVSRQKTRGAGGKPNTGVRKLRHYGGPGTPDRASDAGQLQVPDAGRSSPP